MNVLFCAKVTREGHTIEISECLDDTRILNGPDVKEEDKRGEKNGGQCERDPNEDKLAPPIVHADRDERQEGVRQETA
jgi:hypothetical protein